MIVNKNFPRAVWLSSIFLAPLIMVIFFAARSGEYWNEGFIIIYIIGALLAALIAIPGFFIYKYIVKKVAPGRISILSLKALLIVIAMGLIGLSFILLTQFDRTNFGSDTWVCFFSYSLAVAIATAYFRPFNTITKQTDQ
jgi:hypothetical protein